MSVDPYVGEIALFAGDYPPDGWAFCEGQLLPLSQNTALFSVIGTVYGGDGKSTFALPDLKGSFALCAGAGTGLTPRALGETGGQPTVTLDQDTIPPHSHPLMATNLANGGAADDVGPHADTVMAQPGRSAYYAPADQNLVAMAAATFDTQGAAQPEPHENRPPYQAVNFIIALKGVLPDGTTTPATGE
jgi:microcystin-dependent protein